MGRNRTKDHDLPMNMYFRNGTYWHAARGEWTKLSRNRDEAFARYRDVAATDEGDVQPDTYAEVRECIAKLATGPAFHPGEGVYMLIEAGKVIYVGKSYCIANRVAFHYAEKKFDSVVSIPVESHRLALIERALIRHFRPTLNLEFNPEQAPDIERKRMYRKSLIGNCL